MHVVRLTQHHWHRVIRSSHSDRCQFRQLTSNQLWAERWTNTAVHRAVAQAQLEALCLRFIRTETNHWIPSILPLRAYIMFSIEQVPAGPLLFKVPLETLVLCFICSPFVYLHVFSLAAVVSALRAAASPSSWESDLKSPNSGTSGGRPISNFIPVSVRYAHQAYNTLGVHDFHRHGFCPRVACLPECVGGHQPPPSLHLRRWKHLFTPQLMHITRGDRRARSSHMCKSSAAAQLCCPVSVHLCPHTQCVCVSCSVLPCHDSSAAVCNTKPLHLQINDRKKNTLGYWHKF